MNTTSEFTQQIIFGPNIIFVSPIYIIERNSAYRPYVFPSRSSIVCWRKMSLLCGYFIMLPLFTVSTTNNGEAVCIIHNVKVCISLLKIYSGLWVCYFKLSSWIWWWTWYCNSVSLKRSRAIRMPPYTLNRKWVCKPNKLCSEEFQSYQFTFVRLSSDYIGSGMILIAGEYYGKCSHVITVVGLFVCLLVNVHIFLRKFAIIFVE